MRQTTRPLPLEEACRGEKECVQCIGMDSEGLRGEGWKVVSFFQENSVLFRCKIVQLI